MEHQRGLEFARVAHAARPRLARLGDGVAGAVSYTHLRAHETVLDLVCRLLLEKKKTQRYRPSG